MPVTRAVSQPEMSSLKPRSHSSCDNRCRGRARRWATAAASSARTPCSCLRRVHQPLLDRGLQRDFDWIETSESAASSCATATATDPQPRRGRRRRRGDGDRRPPTRGGLRRLGLAPTAAPGGIGEPDAVAAATAASAAAADVCAFERSARKYASNSPRSPTRTAAADWTARVQAPLRSRWRRPSWYSLRRPERRRIPLAIAPPRKSSALLDQGTKSCGREMQVAYPMLDCGGGRAVRRGELRGLLVRRRPLPGPTPGPAAAVQCRARYVGIRQLLGLRFCSDPSAREERRHRRRRVGRRLAASVGAGAPPHRRRVLALVAWPCATGRAQVGEGRPPASAASGATCRSPCSCPSCRAADCTPPRR